MDSPILNYGKFKNKVWVNDFRLDASARRNSIQFHFNSTH
jgi:hypothetical protein